MYKIQKRRDINKQIDINSIKRQLLDFHPDILRTSLLNSLVKYIKKYIKKINGKKVLFIGGGIGREIIKLKEYESFFAVNLDINFQLLRIGSNYYKINKIQCYCILGDGMQLPFKDNVFDIVILYESLHHMDDLVLCLKESFRVAKIVCIVDRRKCFISKLAKSLGLIQPEIDGFANELDIKWFKNWLKNNLNLYEVIIKYHFLYLLVINKKIHNFFVKIPICYIVKIFVQMVNIFFGYLGNGVVIAVKKIKQN